MTAVKIDHRLTVASQPRQEVLATLAATGFAVIINNRPDGEEPGQRVSAAEKAILEQSGLVYRFIPVTATTITEADIRSFQEAVSGAKGPVYAHCRSGTRSLTLHVLGEVLAGRMKPGEVEAFGRERGFDLSGAVQWLARNAARAPQVRGFYEPRSGSIQYVVADPKTRRCAIIDPVYEFDEKSGATATHQADEILAYVAREGFTVEWILDTHPHGCQRVRRCASIVRRRKLGDPATIETMLHLKTDMSLGTRFGRCCALARRRSSMSGRFSRSRR